MLVCLQIAADASERLTEADSIDSLETAEQYSGLKLLLQTFTQYSSCAPPDNSGCGGQSDASAANTTSTSPLAARTPLWALNSSDLARAGSGKLVKQRSTGLRAGQGKKAVQRRKSNLSKPQTQRKRRKSGYQSASDTASEHDEDLEEAYLAKRNSRSRRRLEEVLVD